jgi:hypothetical protein
VSNNDMSNYRPQKRMMSPEDWLKIRDQALWLVEQAMAGRPRKHKQHVLSSIVAFVSYRQPLVGSWDLDVLLTVQGVDAFLTHLSGQGKPVQNHSTRLKQLVRLRTGSARRKQDVAARTQHHRPAGTRRTSR